MIRRSFALAAALALTAFAPRTGSAQPAASTGDAARAEARDRFDRGLRLFNDGDNAGALAEFKRAYALTENVVVLYNIGLVYAQMGRSVEATDALDRVLQTPDALTPERLAIARRTHDEQATRIAEIAVEANVEGATVDVDGIEAGKTPLARPLRVTSGAHVVGLVASGFAPQRKEVTIASGEKQELKVDLVAMQGRVAHVAVTTHLPGADVFADDQHVGSTPLATSISLSPGVHRIELRRRGYVTAGETLTLGDGATGEVTLEPTEDSSAPDAQRGTLALDVSQTQAVVFVDGRERGVYGAPLALPVGPHHLRVVRGDFDPFDRDVTVDPNRTTLLRVTLEPTPDYRAKYQSHAQTQRTWGIIATLGGAVIAGGGIGLLAYDAKQRSDGNATIARVQGEGVRFSMGLCDPAQDTNTPSFQQNCAQPFNSATSQIGDANSRDYFGWSAVAVGGAAAALGVVLLVTGDDPHRFDRTNGGDHALALPSGGLPTFWTARGGGGVGFSGVF